MNGCQKWESLQQELDCRWIVIHYMGLPQSCMDSLIRKVVPSGLELQPQTTTRFLATLIASQAPCQDSSIMNRQTTRSASRRYPRQYPGLRRNAFLSGSPVSINKPRLL
jgi:hypothetical protein